jgi:leucyl aminopeptidase (aminopeptidase T)
MRTTWISAGAATLVAGLIGAAPTGRAPSPKLDSRELAHRLVAQSARVRAGDLVLVAGGVRDLELLEDVAVEVASVGGHPQIEIGSDRLTRMLYDDVPTKFDTIAPAYSMKVAGFLTAFIAVEYNENPSVLEGVPPARLAARAKAYAPVGALMRKRGVRSVFLGNDLYPTAARAQQFGVSQDQLAEVFWNGVNVDYAALQATGERVRRVLAAGRRVHITNPNGTDLTVGVATRPVFVSDGVISPADVRRGGAATTVWLPAGEVYVTPVPGTAQGTVVADRYFFEGKTIEELRLEFKAGRLVSMTARAGLERLKALYDAAGRGRDLLGAIDIGINPNVRLIPDSRMVGWMPAGMVTVAVGNNTWAGGTNDVGFGITPFLPGSTVTVDGRPLVQNGTLEGELAGR